MAITGQHFIGGERSTAGRETFCGVQCDNRRGTVSTVYRGHDWRSQSLFSLADESFAALQEADPETIARLLDEIAGQPGTCGRTPCSPEFILKRLCRCARLTGECTVGQHGCSRGSSGEGAWVQARIDRGNPERTPLPKPDVRTLLMGVGPVVVFKASNFPLAISVADTIAAFAARCPVVVKPTLAIPAPVNSSPRSLPTQSKRWVCQPVCSRCCRGHRMRLA